MESKDVERGDEEINEVKNNFCNKRKQRRDICTICSKTMRRDNLKRHMMKKIILDCPLLLMGKSQKNADM